MQWVLHNTAHDIQQGRDPIYCHMTLEYHERDTKISAFILWWKIQQFAHNVLLLEEEYG